MFSKSAVFTLAALSLFTLSCGKTEGVSGAAAVLFSNVFTGENHSCGLLADGNLLCWGYNTYGQLGQGTDDNFADDSSDFLREEIFVDLSGQSVLALDGGSGHTCAVLSNNKVKCWGYNRYGQLGLGDTTNRGDDPSEMGDSLAYVDLGSGRTAKSVAVGSNHSCALLDNDTVKCWGYNLYGQLGKDNTSTLGNDNNEMGDNLTAINLGAGRTAKAIAAGGNTSCALLDNDTVKCWGSNGSGQLGQGNFNTIGDNIGEMAALAAIDLGTGRTATAITVGENHACAILDNSTLKCWGSGTYGQLGTGSSNSLGDAGGEMGDNLAAINLGTGRTAQLVTAQMYATCALLDNGAVKCWGYNEMGNLGQEDTFWRGDNGGEMGDNLSEIDLGTGVTVESITAGGNHTCAMLGNGFIKCWGYNVLAQLGLGDTIIRGDEANEMGDELNSVNEANLHQ